MEIDFLGHMSKDQSKCMLKTTLHLTIWIVFFFYKYSPSPPKKKKKKKPNPTAQEEKKAQVRRVRNLEVNQTWVEKVSRITTNQESWCESRACVVYMSFVIIILRSKDKFPSIGIVKYCVYTPSPLFCLVWKVVLTWWYHFLQKYNVLRCMLKVLMCRDVEFMFKVPKAWNFWKRTQFSSISFEN